MSSEPETGPGPATHDDDASGSSRARELARIIEEHNHALHAFLRARGVRDEQEARDVAQEAYIRVLQLDEPGAVSFLRAYIFKTAANIASNRARQRATRHRLDAADDPGEPIDGLSPERRVLAQEEVAVLRLALFELPPKHRRAFVLHRFEEWDVDRIAAELAISARTVRHYLLHAALYCQLRVQGLSPRDAKAEAQR